MRGVIRLVLLYFYMMDKLDTSIFIYIFFANTQYKNATSGKKCITSLKMKYKSQFL